MSTNLSKMFWNIALTKEIQQMGNFEMVEKMFWSKEMFGCTNKSKIFYEKTQRLDLK